jgi:hypothetical protein
MSDQAEEQSLEERMVGVLDAEDQIEDEEVVEEEVVAEEEEAPEEVEEETEEEDSDEEQPAATVRLKVNGEEIEKPLEEVISLAQQGMDYTQKTQKVAEERKQLEDYAQTIKVQEQRFQEDVQIQHALIKEYAQLTSIDEQLEQYQALNWNELSDEDPAHAQKLFFHMNQLQTKRGQLMNELGNKQQQIQQSQVQQRQKLIQEGIDALKRDIPGWNEDMAREIITTGKGYGFTDQELGTVLDPRIIKVLRDASQWNKLQANPTAKQKISQAKPIVKPGAKDTRQQENTKSRQMRDDLRKSGNSEIAIKLIERTL